jgi:hypothetical protein
LILKRAGYISRNGLSVEFEAATPYLVAIDPVFLCKTAHRFSKLPGPTECDPRRELAKVQRACELRMFFLLYEIEDFRPGRYGFEISDIVNATDRPDEVDDSLVYVDVESATIVVADYGHLPRLSQALTWEHYRDGLGAPLGDTRIFDQAAAGLGGEYFAVISSPGITSGYDFMGDGTYIIRPGSVLPVGG